jgi:hypothetical protein
VNKRNFKHGHGAPHNRSRTYITWQAMLGRCKYVKTKEWNRYGGRGIRVYNRWKLFSNFLLDMGIRPSGCWLDRIDNNKGYCKSNCKWSTTSEQFQNRSTTKLSFDIANNIRLMFKTGYSIKYLANMYGVARSTVSMILNNKRWIK